MQEEVENRAVTLVISATKLTARLLKAAILKYLASRKEKRLQKARAAPEKPTGKQTVKQLIGQNQGVSNIEITDSNIKSFERVARKYGVDFAVKKDRSVSRRNTSSFQGAGRRCTDGGVPGIHCKRGQAGLTGQTLGAGAAPCAQGEAADPHAG